MRLAQAVPERQGARRTSKRSALVTRTGETVLAAASAARDWVLFLGEALLAYGRFFRGRGRFQSRDFWSTVQGNGGKGAHNVSISAIRYGTTPAFPGALLRPGLGRTQYVA